MLIYVIKMATLKLTILNLLFLIDSIEKFCEKRSALQFDHPSISPYKPCEQEGKLGPDLPNFGETYVGGGGISILCPSRWTKTSINISIGMG